MTTALTRARHLLEQGRLSESDARALLDGLRRLDAAHRQATWTPYPWQQPPPGDWTVFLLMGGRGTGKTDGAAHWIHDHATGPPCDRRLPGGHRVAIIAPSQGDAAESCYAGPSGLATLDPRITLRTRPGGTYLNWPGGAVAKLFGAYTPEDVERLRAGGNRCLAAGTSIRTTTGVRPIESLRAGDLVWTRAGPRRVLRLWDNGYREVERFRHAAGTVWMTPDHRVWTATGWREAGFVGPDDTVLIWAGTDSPWSTTGSCGTPARTSITRTSSEGCSTASCMNARSGLSPMGATYTIGTTTNATIDPTTSCWSIRRRTSTSTPRSAVRTGTPEGRTQRMRAGSGATSGASDATPHSVGWCIPDARQSGSARPPAGMLQLHHEHGSGGCAACANRSLSARPAARPVPVRGSALQSTRIRSVAQVFDLTVEHDHEFFAGDLLVSNCAAWAEEIAAWRYLEQCWEHMDYGLRLGPRPRVVASTTPKPRPFLRKLLARDDVAVTGGVTADAHHLDPRVRAALLDRYGGTRMGRQELRGELLDDVEGALWTYRTFDEHRVSAAPTDLLTVVVGVDPAVTAGEDSDLTGIVVAARGADHRYYVLADASGRHSPARWAAVVADLVDTYAADRVVAEVNNGGDLVTEVLRRAHPRVRVVPVHASRGKRVRAEPVAALYERGEVSHVGPLPQLEDECATWTPTEPGSPDRMDALVWALTALSGRPPARPVTTFRT